MWTILKDCTVAIVGDKFAETINIMTAKETGQTTLSDFCCEVQVKNKTNTHGQNSYLLFDLPHKFDSTFLISKFLRKKHNIVISSS